MLFLLHQPLDSCHLVPLAHNQMSYQDTLNKNNTRMLMTDNNLPFKKQITNTIVLWSGQNATKSPMNKNNLEKQVKATLVTLAAQSAAVERAGYGMVF